MQKSEEIDQLALALAKAQAVIEDAKRDRENPGAQGARYATLKSVWDAIREPLTANGLSVSQLAEPTGTDKSMAITTLLMHESGQWIAGTMEVPLPTETKGENKGAVKQDPQGAGSAITYTRRYSLMALVGVCPEDDDGQAASQRGGYQNRSQGQQTARAVYNQGKQAVSTTVGERCPCGAPLGQGKPHATGCENAGK